MSTLCRAKWECRMVQGARPSRSLGGASRAALPVKDVFGGTPNTARETRALPTRFSAFQKRVKEGRKISDFSKYFGNISEKQPFSEIISDLFFCRRIAPPGLPRHSPENLRGEGGSGSVKLGQTDAAVKLTSKSNANALT